MRKDPIKTVKSDDISPKNVVTIRELNANLCKILENVVTLGYGIVVTKHGKPYIKVICCNNEGEDVVTIDKSCNNFGDNVVTMPSNVVTFPKNVVTKPVLEGINVVTLEEAKSMNNRLNTYGCGCEREDGHVMCSKHKRL